MLPPLQLLSVYHNPSCDRCLAYVMLKKTECERRIWSTKRSQGRTEHHLSRAFHKVNK